MLPDQRAGDYALGLLEMCCSTRSTVRSEAMAVPKSKITRMKRGHRRSTDALKNPTYVEDKNSGELRRPHHIDLKSGMYRGRQILEPKDNV